MRTATTIRHVAVSADAKPGTRGATIVVYVCRAAFEAQIEHGRNHLSDARWSGYGETSDLRKFALRLADRFPGAAFRFRHS